MLPEVVFAKIRELHSAPGRGYHGWSHPLALLHLLAEVEAELNDPLAVRGAILLHDVVYEPRRSDNEARSALLAQEMLRGIVPTNVLDRIVRMIEATAGHVIPAELPADEAADLAVFLDMDLSILGAPEADFDAYEDGVRYEYRDVPEEAFRAGRAAILEGFFVRRALYLSDWGASRFEASARRNLARSIRKLRQGG
jgi:predicted metal-dependent HD superfamily phosphohydrolase